MTKDCACATARQAARALTQLYDSRLRDVGIEAPQFALLTAIAAHGPCSQVDLIRWGSFDKTTISRNLKVLTGKGWIKTGPKRQLTLTDAGSKMLATAKPKWKKTQDELRSAVGAEQWDKMFVAFRSVTQAVGRLQSKRVGRNTQ